MKKVKFPLKYKMMIMLVSLSAFVLLVFGFLALKDFEKDKLAYVFDTSQAQSLNTAKFLRARIQHATEQVRVVLLGLDPSRLKLRKSAKSRFAESSDFVELSVFTAPAEDEPKQVDRVLSENFVKSDTAPFADDIKMILSRLSNSDIAIKLLDQDGFWLLGLRVNDSQLSQPLLVTAVLKQGDTVEQFLGDGIQESFLLNKAGQIVNKPFSRIYTQLVESDVESAILGAAQDIKNDYGIKQVPVKNGTEQLLVSLGDVGVANLRVASFIPKSKALEAVQRIQLKVFLFLGLMICIAVLVSVLSSSGLTQALGQLTSATHEIAKGNFAYRLNLKSADEIGQLSTNFNFMAGEIDRLLLETAEKSRMEHELETAKLVQSTLFPDTSFGDDNIKIEGHFQSASECGGDWWFHSKIDGKYYLWIGDATGHGAPAALVTAAARAAVSTVENVGGMDPEKIMSLLNKAIYSTAKGQVMMTFFLGVFDPQSKELTYVNASHDPPLLFPATKSDLSKADFSPIMEPICSRLGQAHESEFKMEKMTLNAGDRIIFYTDGITELKNDKDKMFGERRLIKTLISSSEEGQSLPDTVASLADTAETFRSGHALEDDVTLFMVEV